MSTELADQIVLWLLWVAAVPVNIYPWVYLFRPWYSTPQGRALMVKAFGNVIVIDLSLAFYLFGDYPFRDSARVVGFSLFALGIWYLFVTLLTSPGARGYPPLSWFRRRT